MRVALYARVSDDKKKTDGERRQDIDRQINKITNFCKVMEWDEPIQFIDDGISAYKDDYSNRPKFIEMLNEVRANRIQRIVIEDLTRWSRRMEDGIKTLKEASEKATVTSLAEGECNDTTPEGWFKTRIAFLMAEWASKIQSYKVQSGMSKRLNDKTKLCSTCGIVHMGRHPTACKCASCVKRKGRSILTHENTINGGAYKG